MPTANADRPMEPARSAFAITKSDTVVYGAVGAANAGTHITRALYVGGAGTVRVRMLDTQNSVDFECPAGVLLPICVDKVLSTGTDATLIIGLY